MRSSSRGVALGVCGAALALGVGALVVLTGDDGHGADAAPTLPAPADAVARPDTTVAAPTTIATTTPPTTGSTTTVVPNEARPTTTPAPTTTELLEPIDPPEDTYGWEESTHLGGISIPKLGVDENLYEGIRLTTLDKGPGHWPGTAMPGQAGNAVIAAHRTSHGAPFRHIDTLVPGDEVVFDTDVGETRYLVTGTEIVPPTAMWVVDQTEDATATLFACHPPGSVSERIVVHLELAVD